MNPRQWRFRVHLCGSLLGVLALGCLFTGCSDPPPAPTSQPAPRSYRIQLESLATLQPRQPTHLANGAEGTLYFVQEKSTGDDVMFIIPSGGIARASTLTVPRISAALGRREGVSGHIQSLAVDPSGRVYFFFAGGTKRTSLSCFGSYDPATGDIRILADNPTLAKATLMGDAFGLARGTVTIGGNALWLILQNPAMAAVFRISLSSIGESPSLIPAFASLQTPFGKADLSAEEISFAAHPNGNLLVTDRYTGSLWETNSVGESKLVQNLVGAPGNLATAGIDASGNIATVLSDGTPIQPRMEGHSEAADINVVAPIFLLRRGAETLLMGQNAFQSDGRFAVQFLSFEQLIADPHPDRWIAYDRNSGELLRLLLLPVR